MNKSDFQNPKSPTISEVFNYVAKQLRPVSEELKAFYAQPQEEKLLTAKAKKHYETLKNKHHLYWSLIRGSNRMASARAAYEALIFIDLEPGAQNILNIRKEYFKDEEFFKGDRPWDGLMLDWEKLPRIGKEISDFATMHDREVPKNKFSIFACDTYNALGGFGWRGIAGAQNVVSRTLYNYVRDETKTIVRENRSQLDALLGDASWRSDAKKYCHLLLVNSFYELPHEYAGAVGAIRERYLWDMLE